MFAVHTLVFKCSPFLLSPQNKLGDTALHAAAWKGYADIVQLLLAKGKACLVYLVIAYPEN